MRSASCRSCRHGYHPFWSSSSLCFLIIQLFVWQKQRKTTSLKSTKALCFGTYSFPQFLLLFDREVQKWTESSVLPFPLPAWLCMHMNSLATPTAHRTHWDIRCVVECMGDWNHSPIAVKLLFWFYGALWLADFEIRWENNAPSKSEYFLFLIVFPMIASSLG